MARGWLLLGILLTAACAQVAGLNQEYTVAADAAADADDDDPSDAASDAAADTSTPVDSGANRNACTDLQKRDNPCAFCTINATPRTGECRRICEDFGNVALNAYFACLKNYPKDPRDCAAATVFGDEADQQRDCIASCQEACPQR